MNNDLSLSSTYGNSKNNIECIYFLYYNFIRTMPTILAYFALTKNSAI